ncbi:MAG: hypothetical protein CMH57_03110 [Myxococcales bacterium]|nr:hypothetical protein [Myxococcales bacterium]
MCGDGECNGDETADTCAEDCEASPTCGDGECNGAETPASCSEDCGEPAAECETDDDCWGDAMCMDGDCMVASADDYPYEGTPASFINSIALETDGSVGADLDGDGSPDNALGNLLNQLGSLLGDVDINAELAGAIADGDLALGMAWPDLDVASISDASDLTIHVFSMSATEADGVYTADLASFMDGTGNPQIEFNGAEISGGALSAGPAQFAFALNLADIPIELLVDSAQIMADASADGSGVALANGELSGAVPLSAIIDALNGYLASDSCACLELDGDLITGSGASFSCTGTPAGSCSGDAEICSTIANACRLAVPIVSGQADIDLSGDGTADSISVFIRLEAQGATLSGPTPGE